MTFSTSSSSKFRAWVAALALLAAAGSSAAASVGPEPGISPVAVLPIENLTGKNVPFAREIRRSLIGKLARQGITVIPDEPLSRFMAERRMRNTGGIDRELAKAIADETGARTVLVTSLEMFQERFPPRIAFICRLVSTGTSPGILWMDTFALAGEDAPGLLGLGIVGNPVSLTDKATSRAADSLALFQSGKDLRIATDGAAVHAGTLGWERRRFQPRNFYLARGFRLESDRMVSVAVVPFLNDSDRRNAGQIVALQFVNALAGYRNIRIVEPGVLRRELLRFRMVIDEGLNLAQGATLFDFLNVDLIVMGSVAGYNDEVGAYGVPTAAFFAQVLEKRSRKVVWSSYSENAGDDWVYFFEWGRLYTGEAVTAQMVKAVTERIAGTVY